MQIFEILKKVQEPRPLGTQEFLKGIIISQIQIVDINNLI